MQASFIHDGKTVDYTPTAAVEAGSVVVLGSLVGVTKVDIPANALGGLAVVGVFDVEKANVAITLGAKVYWDATAKKANLTTSGAPLGVAVADAVAADTTVRVRLG